MKRFMLVGLMSCMLVGQVSCDWGWSDYGKGLKTALKHTGIAASLGAISGAVLARAPGEAICESKERLLPWAAALAGLSGIGAAGLTAGFASDAYKGKEISKKELNGRCAPYETCKALSLVAWLGYGLYRVWTS